jgi:MGT family glycosyltransferase
MVEGSGDRRRLLIVTWQAGGGAHPAIGLGRLLASRGHDVRILAPSIHRRRVEAARCRWCPFPSSLEMDPRKGRALEDQEEFVIRATTGLPLAQTLLDEVWRDRPDAIVVDHQMRSAGSATELTGVPTASLVHTPYAYHGVTEDAEAWGWDFEPLNRTRSHLGLDPIPIGESRLSVALQRRMDTTLVVMPAEFDPRAETWSGLVHVGPIFEETVESVSWEPPWPAGDARPLVVVSLSSQYMHQEDPLQGVAAGVSSLPVRALILTGFELEPDEIVVPPSVAVERYVPHGAVMPHVSAVVTHGGMGTIMAAFAFGVPALCLPLGRDQHVNSASVERLGAGRSIDAQSSPEMIGDAVERLLASDDVRAGARHMAEVVASYRAGAMAVEQVEALASGLRRPRVG